MKNVHINSCFREKYASTNPSDFKYTIPNEIKNVISMKLASIEIPNSWYLYSGKKKNNHFQIIMKTNNTNITFNIFVPDGNYNSETLVEYLNKEYFYMNENENPDDPNKLLNHIKFSIDEFNNKTKIELVGDNDEELKFSLSFLENSSDNLTDKLGWTLGFRKPEYMDIDDFIFSEGLFDAGGDRYIYFCVNDYQYNVNETNIICFDQTTINENVLAKIPMINGKLCLIVDENDGCSLAKTRRYNGPVNLKRLEIRVMDQFGDIIDLNHMDFSFTLGIRNTLREKYGCIISFKYLTGKYLTGKYLTGKYLICKYLICKYLTGNQYILILLYNINIMYKIIMNIKFLGTKFLINTQLLMFILGIIIGSSLLSSCNQIRLEGLAL